MRGRLKLTCVFSLLLACPSNKPSVEVGHVDAGPKILEEKEPNDRPEQALAITETSIVNARLEVNPAKPDEDWYLLAPKEPRTVDLTVSGIPGADVTLEVYDVDKNRLVLVNSEGDGKPERLPNLGVKDRLFVKVYSAKKGSGGTYSLTAIFQEPRPGFEWEPNDRAADANAVTLGQAISGLIGHSGDEDWYRFDLPNSNPGADAGAPDAAILVPSDAGGSDASIGGLTGGLSESSAPKLALRIELTPIEKVRYELQVLSAAQAILFQTRSKEGEGLSLRNVGVRANDQLVYVVIKSAWIGTGKEARRGYNPDKPYTLTMSPEEAGANAELEPNDDIFRATPLPRDGFREGFLSPKTDVDYYVLRTDEPVLAKFHLSGVDRLDLVLSVVEPDEKGGERVLLRANDGGIKEPEVLNNVYCPKQCWVKVEGALKKIDGKWVRDYENSEQPYRLTVSVKPDTGAEEREPNNTPEQANPILLARPIRGTIQPKKDVDFYRLNLKDRPVRTPIKATVTGILKVHIGLYLHRQEDDGKLTLVQTADTAKGDAPEIIRYSAEPAVYFLQVRDSKNRESNFQDYYHLTVEESE